MADRAYTDADLDAAISAVSDPGRLQEAQDLVSRIAPSLQRVLASALREGGWFDSAHDQAVREATAGEDPCAHWWPRRRAWGCWSASRWDSSWLVN